MLSARQWRGILKLVLGDDHDLDHSDAPPPHPHQISETIETLRFTPPLATVQGVLEGLHDLRIPHIVLVVEDMKISAAGAQLRMKV